MVRRRLGGAACPPQRARANSRAGRAMLARADRSIRS